MLLKLDYLCRKNRTMFLKILILDVHRQKNFGNLKGSTPKEQYDYYEKKYLNNATYIKSLLQEYPELKRLLELKNNSIQRAECEIRKSLYAEKEQIQKIFCDGRKFSGTVGIYMSKGDIHRGGRSVAKVEFPAGRYNIYLMIPMDGKKKLRIFPVKTKVRWSIIISEWAYICFWDMPLEQQIFMVKILSHMENIL